MTIIENIHDLQNIFISAEHWGDCLLCGEYEDRRFGVCFRCSDHAKVSVKRGVVIDIRNNKEYLVPWIVDPMAEARNVFRKTSDGFDADTLEGK